MGNSRYNSNFFSHLQEDSYASAKVIVPLVRRYIQPKSILDVGCGTGAFLSVFKETGSNEVFGVDGPWVSREERRVPDDSFQVANLEEPLELHRTFDLVVSVEVAEHISEAAAKTFVKSLTQHGDIVLFSAAIPHQGGTHHINEQWPSYWVQLFAEEGYVPIDCLRREVWESPQVNFWFAQNILFFAKRDTLARYPELQKAEIQWGGPVLPLVHPTLFKAKAKKAERFDRLTSIVPYSVKGTLLKFVRKF
ncbi:MAG TPA: class I SAM-dependent methyltransferase [Candidatus Paceibacterota bacterium]